MKKFIILLLLAANTAWLSAAADSLPSQTQNAGEKTAETNGAQAIPQSLREILRNPEGWEMDIYSFPSEIDTFVPVSAEQLYAKGLNVSHVHTSDKALVGEGFSILNNMEFKNYSHELRETRFLIKLKHSQKDIEIILLDEANAPDFMIFQIEKIENGKVEKFPTGITVQAGALKRLAKRATGK